MMQGLSQRQHALLALAILLAVLILLFMLLIMPAINARIEFHERLGNLQFQYGKLSYSIAQLDSLKNEIKELKQSQPDQAGFLKEQPDALAAADLQKNLDTLISSSDGNVISTQVVQNNNDDSLFPEVTVKVHMRGDIESFQKILYQLRVNNPVLLIDNLHVQQRNINRNRRRKQQAIDLLELRFDITGFVYQANPAS